MLQTTIDLIYLDEWLADPSKPKLLLVGEPGSGKTAIAGRLYQFSKREVTPLEDLKYIGKGFINAIHFCSTTYRNNPWINSNSTIFVESLAMQLAEFFPKYAKALNEISGDRQAQINVEQHIQTVGNVIGNIIENIDLRSASY